MGCTVLWQPETRKVSGLVCIAGSCWIRLASEPWQDHGRFSSHDQKQCEGDYDGLFIVVTMIFC